MMEIVPVPVPPRCVMVSQLERRKIFGMKIIPFTNHLHTGIYEVVCKFCTPPYFRKEVLLVLHIENLHIHHSLPLFSMQIDIFMCKWIFPSPK